jgi:hypothetical protein
MSNKVARNDICPCGSGKKYKKCCGFKAQTQGQLRAQVMRRGSALPFFNAATTTLTNRIFKVVKSETAQDLSAMKITKKEAE